MNLSNKYLIYFFLFLVSCGTMKTVSLYDLVEEKENPYDAFPYKNIFTDSDKTGVYGWKVHPCKEINFDTVNNYSGNDHLHIKWNKTNDCKWLGFGFKWGNFKSKNLLPIIDNSAIELMIRADSGEFFKVPIIFGLVDYSEKQCFSKINFLGMEDGVVDEKWRKVTVPLSTFKYLKKGLNITNVKELRVQLLNKGNFHVDDIKIVPHVYNYQMNVENFTKVISELPVNLGLEKKYWWGVNENYSNNFKFITNSESNIKNYEEDNNQTLPEMDVSLSLSVNYNSLSNDKNWNTFGFPFNNWEFGDLSEIYSTAVLYFSIKAKKVPKFKVSLVSFGGKLRSISKLIQDQNIFQTSENTFEIYLPFKSFNNYDNIDWTKMKELRFRILESSNFEVGNFKLLEFRGNPNNPVKWYKS